MGVCIVLDGQGDESELEASKGDEMNHLLTALHLEVMLVDLRIRML